MLRRALIFLCLVAPLAAEAQLTDAVTITLQTQGGTVLTPPLGRIRCDGNFPGYEDPTISFNWQMALTTTPNPPAAEDTYRLAITTTGACPGTPTDGAGLIDTVASGSSVSGRYPATGTISLAALLAKVPLDCKDRAIDTTVRICVALVRSANGNVDKTINNSFELQLASPPDPSNVTAGPGESALNISWAAGTKGVGEADNDRYEVKVTPRNAGLDPGGTRTSTTAATSLRQGGLVNGVTYDIEVTALSRGGNRSTNSATGTGVPAPVNDFFEQYKLDGGKEEGGCAGGPAGLLSLLGLGAALRLFRRRS